MGEAKYVYAFRNTETKKIEDVIITNSGANVDGDRTGFYYECSFFDSSNYTESFIKELVNQKTIAS